MGETDAYKEFSKKNENRSEKDNEAITEGLMNIFAEFDQLMAESWGLF